MSKTIEIQRRIDRYRGNKMLLSKIRSGAYQLKTGEAGYKDRRQCLYADQFDNEIDEFVDEIDKEEKLRLTQSEKRRNAKELKNQIHEGKSKLVLRFHDKDSNVK